MFNRKIIFKQNLMKLHDVFIDNIEKIKIENDWNDQLMHIIINQARNETQI